MVAEIMVHNIRTILLDKSSIQAFCVKCLLADTILIQQSGILHGSCQIVRFRIWAVFKRKYQISIKRIRQFCFIVECNIVRLLTFFSVQGKILSAQRSGVRDEFIL